MTVSVFIASEQSDDSSADVTDIYQVSGDMDGTYSSLSAAFAAINSSAGTNFTIIVSGNDPDVSTFALNAVKSVTLKSSEGNAFVLYKSGDLHGHIMYGSLTLENIILDGSKDRGGILVYSNGTFTMNGGAVIQNCYAIQNGGGVKTSGTFIMNGGSIIRDNIAKEHGGGVCNDGGVFYMSGDAAIYGNSLYHDRAYGGGVSNIFNGIFNMSDQAVVSGNKATFYAGGVFNWFATFNMSDDAAIYDNVVVTSGNYGGGVVNHTATFNMSGGVIRNNEATYGGGIFNIDGTFNMNGNAKIHNNNAPARGGGVYNNSYDFTATFNMSGNAAIFDNNVTTANSYGGGVFNGSKYGIKAIFNMWDNAVIYGNSATAENSYGGGVFNSTGTFTMSGGKISGNTTNLGGGIYNADVLGIAGGTISGNTASLGGGIYNTGMLDIAGGTISGNIAKKTGIKGSGGGIYTSNFTNLTVASGVVFSGNKAPLLRTENIVAGADVDSNTISDLDDYSNIGNVVLNAPVKLSLNAPAYNNFDINYPGSDYVVYVDIEADDSGAVAVIDSNTGTVYGTLNVDGYVYVPGTVTSITLTAAPRSEYEFRQFTIDGTLKSSDNTLIVPINGNMSVLAEFELLLTVIPPEEEHCSFITATSDSGSEIDPKGVVKVPYKGTQSFIFSAKPGYKVVSVYVDGKAISSAELASGKYTFTDVVSNHKISVVSEANGGSGGNIGDGGSGGTGEGDGNGADKGSNTGKGDGRWAVLNLICAILTIFVGAIVLIEGRNRFKTDNEEKRSKTALTFRALALIIGIASVFIFLLTEDWTLPVTAIDKWTLLMFILFIATLVLTLISFRLDEKPKDETEASVSGTG